MPRKPAIHECKLSSYSTMNITYVSQKWDLQCFLPQKTTVHSHITDKVIALVKIDQRLSILTFLFLCRQLNGKSCCSHKKLTRKTLLIVSLSCTTCVKLTLLLSLQERLPIQNTGWWTLIGSTSKGIYLYNFTTMFYGLSVNIM